MSIMSGGGGGGGSTAGSLFVPNGLSLHIDHEALQADEEEERRREEEKQAEQLRQLVCEELDDDLLSDDDDDDDDDDPSLHPRVASDRRTPGADFHENAYEDDAVRGQRDVYGYEDLGVDFRQKTVQDHNWNDVRVRNGNYEGVAEEERNGHHHFDTRSSADHAPYLYGEEINYQPVPQQRNDSERLTASPEERQMAQLQILYKARGRRLEEVTNEFHILKEDSDREIRMLKHQVNLAGEENMQLKDTIDRLEAAQQEQDSQSDYLSSQLRETQSQLSSSETARADAAGRLRAAEEEIVSLRRQLEDLSRADTLARAKREHEEIVAGIVSRHKEEVAAFDRRTQETLQLLNEKENLSTRLRAELDAVTRGHEKALMERAETINRLSRSLEETQRQCAELLRSGSVMEIEQLKAEVSRARESKGERDTLCQTLMAEVVELKEQLRTASRVGVGVEETVRKNLNFDTPEIEKTVKITEPEVEEESLGLKSELERALKTIRMKRTMIENLQAKLSEKEELCESLRAELRSGNNNNNSNDNRNSGDTNETKPLEQRIFMTERERNLSAELETLKREKSEMEDSLSHLQIRIDELISGEEQLMLVNRELSEKLERKDAEFEEREKRSVDEARDACIAFYESAKQDLARRMAEEAEEDRKVLTEELEELKANLAAAEDDVNSARQNYIKLSKESRDEMLLEKEKMAEEMEKRLAEAVKESENQLLSRIKDLNEQKNMLECEKNTLIESKNNLQTEHGKILDAKETQSEDFQLKLKDLEEKNLMIEKLKNHVAELEEQMNDKRSMSNSINDSSREENHKLTAQIKALEEKLSRANQSADKEKIEAINSEKIRQETRYQLKLHELQKNYEMKLNDSLEEAKKKFDERQANEMKYSDQNLKQLQSNINSYEKEIEKLKSELKSAEMQMSEHKKNARLVAEKDEELKTIKVHLEKSQQQLETTKLQYEDQLQRIQQEMRRKSLKLKSVDGLVEEQLKSLRLDLEHDFERGMKDVATERDKYAKLYREKEEDYLLAQEQLDKWQKASAVIDEKFKIMVHQYEEEISKLKNHLSSMSVKNSELEKYRVDFLELQEKYRDNLETTASLKDSVGRHGQELDALNRKLENLKKSYRERLDKCKSRNREEDENQISRLGKDLTNHYIASLNKIKSDVLQYIRDLKEHFEKTQTEAVYKERKKIAQTLRKYYVDGIESICATPQTDHSEIQFQLTKLLNKGFDSMVQSAVSEKPRRPESPHLPVEKFLAEKIASAGRIPSSFARRELPEPSARAASPRCRQEVLREDRSYVSDRRSPSPLSTQVSLSASIPQSVHPSDPLRRSPSPKPKAPSVKNSTLEPSFTEVTELSVDASAVGKSPEWSVAYGPRITSRSPSASPGRSGSKRLATTNFSLLSDATSYFDLPQ